MGMIGHYYMTDKETVQKVQQGEISLWDLIYDENDDVDEEFLLDIDKSWHAIHFVLTGEIGGGEGILEKVVLRGTPNLVSDEDMGYGPATLTTAEEVQEIHQAIKDIAQADFRSKFSIKEMAENDIYPIIADENEEDFFSYVWSYFAELQTFFAKAADQGHCVLFYIS